MRHTKTTLLRGSQRHEDRVEESDEEECEEYDSAYDLTEDTLVGLTRDT